jgi:hypothetical protein
MEEIKMKENDDNVINLQKEGAEQLPLQIVERIFREECNVRIALARHSITKEIAPCVPYREYATAFSYDSESIRQMIQRTKWLKKYSTACMIQAVDGRFRIQTCIFEEAMIGIFGKLQPDRCEDKKVAEHIEELKESMALLLRDVLRDYTTGKQDPLKMSRHEIWALGVINRMSEGWDKEAAIASIEQVTGKRYSRPRQLELAFTRKPDDETEK